MSTAAGSRSQSPGPRDAELRNVPLTLVQRSTDSGNMAGLVIARSGCVGSEPRAPTVDEAARSSTKVSSTGQVYCHKCLLRTVPA